MSSLTPHVTRFLQVRAGEGRLVVLLAALMFVASTGGAIGSPGVEAIFFARFGVQFLPYMYIALGIATIAVSLLMTVLLARVAQRQLYVALPLVLAAYLIVARGLVGLDLGWFYPVLWLSMNILWALQTLFTWGLAGMACDARQAKRLFPLFGAGALLGISLGGLITTPLVRLIGSENLLLCWTAALVAAFALAQRLSAAYPGERRQPRRRRGLLEELQQGYRFSRQSPLMRWMALAAVLFAILYFSLVFPFSQAAAAQFPDENTLAGFLGVLHGAATAVGIGISLMVANRFYAAFGIMAAILIYTVLYLAGFSLMIFAASFALLTAFRAGQLIWNYGIAEGANQAMFNVVPTEAREQTRTFVRGIANQAGVSLAGALLLVAELWLQPRLLYLLAALTAALAVYLVARAQRAYGQAVVAALAAGQPHLFYAEEEPFGGFRRDAQATAAAIGAISNPNPAVRRVAATVLGNLAVPEAIDAMVRGLEDEEPQVRAALLRGLARAEATPALLNVLNCLQDPEPQVRSQAVQTLSALTGYPAALSRHLQPMLADSNSMVRGAAAAALLATGPHPEAEETLKRLASDGQVDSRLAALEALARWASPAAYELASQALQDQNPLVRRGAAAALRRIRPTDCVDPLVGALGDADELVRHAAAQALGDVGEQALAPVLAALDDPATEPGALQALGFLPASQAADEIRAYARSQWESALHYYTLWSACTRQEDSAPDAGAPASLLAEALLNRSRRHGEYALRALGALADAEAMGMALDSVTSPNPQQRANAMETMEALVGRDIVRPLTPLWDPGESGPQAGPSWLLEVLQDQDPWLRACGAVATWSVEEPAGKPLEPATQRLIQQLAQSDPDELVRQAARLALPGAEPMRTLPTLSTMERILFLKQVPLFAALSPADLKHVAEVAGEHFFGDGQVIARQDEPGDELYMIISGQVQVALEDEEGTLQEVAQREPGEHVGEMALLDNQARTATLVAIGEVRALCLNQQQFAELIRARPEASLAVMRVLSARLQEATEEQAASAHAPA